MQETREEQDVDATVTAVDLFLQTVHFAWDGGSFAVIPARLYELEYTRVYCVGCGAISIVERV